MEIKSLIEKLKIGVKQKKNTSFMLGGRFLAQIIPILLTPLFTRIYSPEEFGYFGAYVTIVSIISMLSNGRYCLAIMLPKDEEKAKHLTLVCILLTVLSSVLFALILLFEGSKIFVALNITLLTKYTLILVLSVLFIGVYEAFFYYFLRSKRYKEIAINIIVQAGFLVLTKILFGYLGYTEGGLMYSYLASYLIGSIMFSFQSWKELSSSFKNFTKTSISQLTSTYSKFPKFSLFADLLKNLTFLSPNLLFNKIYGAVAAGYYSLSDKILGSPVWFLTSSFGDVLKQEASEQYRENGTCIKVVKQTSSILFVIGIIPFAAIFFFAPALVPFVFGAQWEPAGQYIRIFSIMYFARFVVEPITDVMYIIERQKVKIYFEIMKLAALIIGLSIGLVSKNYYYGLVAWSLLTSLVYIICFGISYKLAKTPKHDFEK